jgi:hypothetical protein
LVLRNVSGAIAADLTGTASAIADNSVTSAKIVDGTIVNADINASAGIDLTKLATGALPATITVASANIVTETIVNADISATAAIDKTKINGTAITAADAGTVTSTMIADGTIVNADINASAQIVDTKLATIATALKVSNSATTATNANTASAIVARDASGNFAAGTITADVSGSSGSCTGNAATSTKLSAAKTFALTGDVTGSASSDLTTGPSIGATIANDAVTFAKMQNSAAAGLSVVGRSAATAGDFAELTAATDGHVVRRSGSAVGFGTVATAGIADAAVTAPKLSGAQTGSAPIFGVRAWGKFEGQTSNIACTVNASGNVTSVTRTSTGVYEVVMTTAPSSVDALYAVLAMSNQPVSRLELFTETTTTFRLEFLDLAGALQNPAECMFMVIR